MPVAILVLDINMPKKNGIKALEEIFQYYDSLETPLELKRDAWISYPKVIIMSGYAPPKMIQNFLTQKNVDYFIASPFGSDDCQKIFKLYEK